MHVYPVLGTYTGTVTVTDSAGNRATQSFTVPVVDHTAPRLGHLAVESGVLATQRLRVVLAPTERATATITATIRVGRHFHRLPPVRRRLLPGRFTGVRLLVRREVRDAVARALRNGVPVRARVLGRARRPGRQHGDRRRRHRRHGLARTAPGRPGRSIPAGMGRRSRKRRTAPAAVGGPAARRATPDASGGASPHAAPPSHRARMAEAPKAPWSPFPLVEICVLIALVLIVARGRVATARAAACSSPAGSRWPRSPALELAVREHFAGFRSHSALLAGAVAVVAVLPLFFLTGLPQIALLAVGVVVYSLAFFVLPPGVPGADRRDRVPRVSDLPDQAGPRAGAAARACG